MSFFFRRRRNAPKSEKNSSRVATLAAANRLSNPPGTPAVSDEVVVFRLARERRGSTRAPVDVPYATRPCLPGRHRSPCPAWWMRLRE